MRAAAKMPSRPSYSQLFTSWEGHVLDADCPTTDRPRCQVVQVIASCLPHERATLLDFESVWQQSGLELIKLFSCSTQLGMKFILLINVKMPTIVGILTFLSRIHTTSSCLRAGKMPHFFTFYLLSSWSFVLNWVEQEKIIILRPHESSNFCSRLNCQTAVGCLNLEIACQTSSWSSNSHLF